MSHIEQELLTVSEHLSSPPVIRGVRVARSLVFCVMFCRSLFALYYLAIVLSVLRCTVSCYPFDLFSLFLHGLIFSLRGQVWSLKNSLFPYGKWVVRQMCVRGIEFLFRFRNCSYSYSVLFLGFHFIQECWLLERWVILSTRQTNLLNVNTIYSTHFIHRI